MKSRCRIILSVLSVISVVCGCATSFENQPSLDETARYAFTIDGQTFNVSMPIGGVEGEYNVSEISTSAMDRDYVIMFTAVYDLYRSRFHSYHITSFDLQVSIGNRCIQAIGEADNRGSSTPGSQSVESIAGFPAAYAETIHDNRKFITSYRAKVDEDVCLEFFLGLHIDKIPNEAFKRERLEMFHEIVGSVETTSR